MVYNSGMGNNENHHPEKPRKSRARIRRGTKETGLTDGWKAKISATKIMNRLDKCVDGEVVLTAQQIKAAEIILKKIVPDVARVEQQQLDKDGNATDPVKSIEIVLVQNPNKDT